MSELSAVVAFSGGLDTSFVVPFSRERYGVDRVITCTVNTGGFSDKDLEIIADRSKEVGADEHVVIDAQALFYQSIIKYLIYGNVSRDGYPLCVGAERLVQIQECMKICAKYEAGLLLHGCTGAGNDQYRFDLAIEVLGKGKVKSAAPIRDDGITRRKETEFLRQRGVKVEERSTKYSLNPGLWGCYIGGEETHTARGLIPETEWTTQPEADLHTGTLELSFEKGEVVAVRSEWGNEVEPVQIIKKLTEIGGKFGIGRHYHIGTSIPGKKGRLAYESPAADIIYEAHRTLEKLTLSGLQISGKKPLAEEFGRLVHEAHFFDPYLEDIKAFLTSTQTRVTGDCTVHLGKCHIKAITCSSPYNLLELSGASYGEENTFYSGDDARGACRVHAFEQVLHHSIEE